MNKKRAVGILAGVVLLLVIFLGTISKNKYAAALDYVTTPFKEQLLEKYPFVWADKTEYIIAELLQDVPQTEDAPAAYGSQAFFWQEGDLAFQVTAAQAGVYRVGLDFLLPAQENIPLITLAVNGDAGPAQSAVLNAMYALDDYNFHSNHFGNDIYPGQIQREIWASSWLRVQSLEPQLEYLTVSLQKGVNTFLLKKTGGVAWIGEVFFEKEKSRPDYTEYLTAMPAGDVVYAPQILEAEQFYCKNQQYISLLADIQTLASPYEAGSQRINMVDGTTFKNHGDRLVYLVEIEKAGYYPIGLRYSMPEKPNTPVFIDIEVDGEVPFAQFSEIKLDYTRTLKNAQLNQTPVYLEAGIHEIAFVINTHIYQDMKAQLDEIVKQVNDLGVAIKKLTGNNQDKNRDWTIADYLPDMQADMQRWQACLKEIEKSLLQITDGQKTEEINNVQMAIRQLQTLLSDPDKVPSRLAVLSQGSTSVLKMVSATNLLINTQNLNLDQIFVGTVQEDLPPQNTNIFYDLSVGFTRFLKTFEMDRERKASTGSNETINIWMNYSRQFVDVAETLAAEKFTPQTGIQVQFSMMTDQNKLTLANAAGKQPDGALGVDSFYINDLATRGSLANLREFEALYEILPNFSPGAMLQMVIDDKLYGLPEMQDFYLLFYRTDIFESYGLEVPQTWEEVLLMMPKLQRNGMNFYTPLASKDAFKSWPATIPFYSQFGADIYSADGNSTMIDSNEGIAAMQFMTELFTIYGMPAQVAEFYNDFRYGEIPMGISNFNTYIQLTYAAPEIKGQWAVAPVPGMKNQDGEIERWTSGGSRAGCMFEKGSKKEQTWAFLQWWLSDEIQAEYVRRLQNMYGPEFLWNSGNLNVLEQMPLPQADIDVIKEQVQWIKEAPKIPGGYFTEREVSNAWNKIVFEGVDTRTAVEDAVMVANREIERKLEEFGYMKNGEMVRPYQVPTIEQIEGWQFEK